MTSLTGFEALLRQKKVVCYGSPFYAGWGLTEDHLPHPRRQRSLSLRQLVAGALLSYAAYIHPQSLQRMEAEAALETLAVWRQNTPAFHSSFLELCVSHLYRQFVVLQNKFHDLKRTRQI
jgi:capsular polysaccharide export protein